jgi:hypothetical protein
MVCADSSGSAGSIDDDRHKTAARASFHLGVGQLLLSGEELALHLLRRREQLLHIQLTAGVHVCRPIAHRGCLALTFRAYGLPPSPGTIACRRLRRRRFPR